MCYFFFFSSRRRHTRSLCDWSSDVCSSDLTRSVWSWMGVYREALTLSNRPSPLHHASTTLSSLPELCYNPSRRLLGAMRSEERRVGKECRSRWGRYHEKRKTLALDISEQQH